MKVINILVTDKLKVTSVKDGDKTLNANIPVEIPSGNYRSVALNFTFDSKTWEEVTLTKYATFSVEGGDKVQVKLEEIGDLKEACYVPYNILKRNCRVNVGVYGNYTYNGQITKVVSAENLHFQIIDGAFSAFLSDETPPKIETMEEQMKNDLESFVDNLSKEFNNNYQNKLNNLNSNILDVEGELENKTGITFDKYADSKRIENEISTYISMTPDYKTYTVKFPLWDTSNTCAGEKLDDNKGLNHTPATDTEREVTDYLTFGSIDCNAEVDDNGVRHITALKGMCTFRDTGKVDVFCLFRTYWQKIWQDDGYLYISRRYVPTDGYDIVPMAINKDGTYNNWFVIGKYQLVEIPDESGTHHLYGSKGLMPAHNLSSPIGEEEIVDNISYSGCITLLSKKGKYYSAGLMAEYMHLLTTFYLEFATKNTQSIMYGHANNNYQYPVAVPESNKNRVILTTAQANNFDLNTFVSVGDRGSNTNNDRNNGYMHNIVYNAKIIKKEVIDSTHTALVLDHKPFNTTSTTYVSTMHEKTGFSDSILGRTGSIGSNTNGKHGLVLEGVELMTGGYEVIGNAICNITGANERELYYTNDASKLTTNSSTAINTYKKAPNKLSTLINGWNYITEMSFDTKEGLYYPTKAGVSGAGGTVGYADGHYADSNSTSGVRELLALGHLGGATLAGLGCVYSYYGVSCCLDCPRPPFN